MDRIEIKTLIDVTNTGVTRPKQGSQLELDQNKNFVTLKQCLEIRSIISYDEAPVVEELDLKSMGFGTAYKGKQAVWTFTVYPDRSGVYADDQGNPIGELFNDLHEIPVIQKLTETINIDRAVFDLKDSAFKNTIITAHKGTI